jgi:hypothetical protein
MITATHTGEPAALIRSHRVSPRPSMTTPQASQLATNRPALRATFSGEP